LRREWTFRFRTYRANLTHADAGVAPILKHLRRARVVLELVSAMPTPQCNRRRGAFTLVELLCVIGSVWLETSNKGIGIEFL
jgi:hypothetical protein